MAKISEKPKATFESVWESFQENDRQMKEMREDFDQRMKKSNEDFDRLMKESELARKASNEDFDRRMKESELARKASNEDFDRRMKKHDEILGAWSNNFGAVAEEYFINSFEMGRRNFFGEKFDEIENRAKGIKKGYRDEYDIVFINGKSVGIVEIKYKAHVNDISKVIRKAETFRANFPDYASHQVYLGLASLAFYPELEQECIENGIAIVKQAGDTMVINDSSLKVY